MPRVFRVNVNGTDYDVTVDELTDISSQLMPQYRASPASHTPAPATPAAPRPPRPRGETRDDAHARAVTAGRAQTRRTEAPGPRVRGSRARRSQACRSQVRRSQTGRAETDDTEADRAETRPLRRGRAEAGRVRVDARGRADRAGGGGGQPAAAARPHLSQRRAHRRVDDQQRPARLRDADRHVPDHRTPDRALLEQVRQRADALHAAADHGRGRDARRPPARLSGLARLRASAGGLRRNPVRQRPPRHRGGGRRYEDRAGRRRRARLGHAGRAGHRRRPRPGRRRAADAVGARARARRPPEEDCL